jgi:hypothetical protein
MQIYLLPEMIVLEIKVRDLGSIGGNDEIISRLRICFQFRHLKNRKI